MQSVASVEVALEDNLTYEELKEMNRTLYDGPHV